MDTLGEGHYSLPNTDVEETMCASGSLTFKCHKLYKQISCSVYVQQIISNPNDLKQQKSFIFPHKSAICAGLGGIHLCSVWY